MTLPVSIVVVSRGRPDALARCLTGLSQLLYPLFEIVVVADPTGIAACGPWSGRMKVAAFDEPNISAARNLGIAQAAGDVVAFIDDDAVPEPTWLAQLVAPFALPEVAAAGGRVLGRNGISAQWPDRDIRADATSHILSLEPTNTTLLTGQPGRGIKTEGTNMAFRRSALAAIGGFDPAYRFYLDESDLNLRLAATGAVTALVPGAVVHHGFGASDRRRGDRVALSLHEVGASLAVFARRHGTPRPMDLLAREERDRRRGLIGHLIAGRVEPRDVRRLLSSLRTGWDDGAARHLGALSPINAGGTPFLAYAPLVADRGAQVLSGAAAQAPALRAQATALAVEGWRVSLFILSRGWWRHRVRFDPAGYWIQTGGIRGLSVRSGPKWRRIAYADRVAAEISRVADVRGLDHSPPVAPQAQ